jgi:transposase
MSGLILSGEDRAYFLVQMRRHLDSAVHRRMNALLLLDDGWEPGRIAQALYLDERTVADFRRRYEALGRTGIERFDYVGRRSLLLPEQERALSAHVDASVPLTSRQVCAFAKQAFGIGYTPNAMTKLLKRLGFVHKKPKCVPAKADDTVQRQFAAETLRPLMEAASEALPLYFVDAVHPAYTGRPAHGWMRRGTTRELKSNHGRSRLNINGALCWHDLSLLHRQEEKITSVAMIALFEDIAARHPTASAIAVVMDNAKYNISREIKAYFARKDCRIRPVYLPSYAPNLNLIERLWRFMKRRVLHNRYYPKFAQFHAAFEDFFAHVGGWKDQPESLLTPKFHFIGVPKNAIP